MPDRIAEENRLCRLADSARGGDTRALAGLLRGLQDTLWRFCVSQLADPDAAEEAVQETAARLIEAIPRFQGRSTASTWALGVALNVCRERRRSRAAVALNDAGFDPPDGRPAVAERLIAREQAATLREKIRGLADRQREAVVLRYFEQLSIEETAAVMGCSAGTVKATLWQALRRLKEPLHAIGIDSDE